MKKKLLLILCIIIVITGVSFFVVKKQAKVVDVNEIDLRTTVNEIPLYISSESNSSSSFVFYVVTNYNDFKNIDFQPTFNQDVKYSYSYSVVNIGKTLPIEYYLAAETEMNLEEELENFQLYLARSSSNSDSFEENEEYEKYIEDYKKSSYIDIGEGYRGYQVKIEVTNFKDMLGLQNIKYIVNNDDENVVVYEQPTNIVFSSSNTTQQEYSKMDVNLINPQPNARSIIEYTYKCKGNYEIMDATDKNNMYKINSVTYRENDIQKDLPFKCEKDKIIDIIIDYEKNEPSSYTIANKMLSATLTTNNGPLSIATSQEISPYNLLLLLVEDMNIYNEYFDYRFNNQKKEQ